MKCITFVKILFSEEIAMQEIAQSANESNYTVYYK